MAYTKTVWENSTTPLSATNMNHIETGIKDAHDMIEAIADMIYPVGSIYMSVTNTDPGTIFGGTWTRIKDTFLLSAGDSYTAGTTGGAATVTLTTDEMPSHTHVQNAHTHTQNSHTHTQNQHRHNPAGANNYVPYATGSNRSWRAIAQGGYQWSPGVWDTNTGGWAINTGYATATNNATTATNIATTATNQDAGGGQAHNNMPPYLVVYVWQRTA